MRMAIIALSLLLLPIAYALTCSKVAEENLDSCNEIIYSNATDEEKQQLIADLTYGGKDYANHSFVYDWNTNINFNSAPYGVEVKSDGYIKDAWIKIVAILPSVIDGDKQLSPGIGKVLSAYNYRVEIPSETELGDCKTNFNLKSNENWLDVYLNDELIVYLNNQLVGTSILIDFQGSGVLNFKDKLRIKTVTEVEHYKPYVWCCSGFDENGICKEFCEECEYDSTENRVHEVNLEDVKTAYHYWPIILPRIKAANKYQDTTVGILNISNFDAFSLSFKDASFKQFNYYYDINVSLLPYDVFTLRANKFAKKEAKNLIVEQFNSSYKFYVSNDDSCKIRFYDHFHSWEQNCNLDYNFTLFEIKTDKLQYDENETINVDLEPKDTTIKVEYGNEEVLAKNNVTFNAKKNDNKITAYLEEREAQKIIHVKRKTIWNSALNLGVFSGIIYSFYLLLKKYWGSLI